MTEFKTMKQVEAYWKILEMAVFDEWVAANDSKRQEIIKKTVKIEMKIFNKFLKYKEDEFIRTKT